ncbi:Molybdenum cofactor biosynthesis, MoeB [Metarhizium rileyi]|uniref:Adenylyltransferase and sulfurtransferase uba4 n=1 Tax=Metarhizium rileyi (strain RCEF 4871) TaxID=1649241 RepID=A0A167HZA8_METRR|nr:Molybdenum cofactor biosynthesis, MoeB [Metarhizium rileyi RCEF 4871]
MEDIDLLRREIAVCESELARLRSRLAAAEAQQQDTNSEVRWKWPLKEHEYQRYGRQMIVPNFGLDGQLRLRRANVLLVGAGGLGCPAAAYLAGSGVGVIGLVDGDEVEVSNLHRQVAHSTARVGMAKVESAIAFLRELNPTVTYKAHVTHLTPQNAHEIVSQYDLVLDCTDHPTSRYLISDICVLLGKPLVSASAFQTSGQLIVLNNPAGKGPCYRCVFPKPPPPESVVGCGEGGIIGPVVGVMGVLQALEAIKLISRGGLETDAAEQVTQQTMLLFSGMADGAPFRSVRMRGKRTECFACGENAELTLEYLQSSMDYVQFCGVTRPVQLLQAKDRVTAQTYHDLAVNGTKHILVDVRGKEHFGLSHIPGSINVPISRFMSHRNCDSFPEGIPADLPADASIYMVCRVGNDSQVAAAKLKEMGLDRNGSRFIGDIFGGLKSWKDTVDDSIPFL